MQEYRSDDSDDEAVFNSRLGKIKQQSRAKDRTRHSPSRPDVQYTVNYPLAFNYGSYLVGILTDHNNSNTFNFIFVD